MKLKAKVFYLFTVLIFVLVGSLTPCLAEEKKPINFFMLTDLTGPVHAQVATEGWAAEDYFAWLNKRGGIDGHPVNLQVIDTKYSLPLIRTAYARVKATKHMTVSFDALSGGIEAHRVQFAKDKIPVLMLTGHGPANYPPSWVFAVIPAYDDILCAYADYIASIWKEKRKPRLALLLGDYGSGRAPAQAQWYVEKKGIDVVALEYVPLQPTDTSDILIRIRDKNPDFIFDSLVPDQMKVVLKDRLKLGIKIPQATFFFNSFLIKGSVPPEAYGGLMGFESLSCWWEKEVPGVKLAYKDEFYGKRGEAPPTAYMLGLGGCMVWTEAVKNALRKVGYENLDGPAIFDGYMAIRDFDAMGIFPSITYTMEDRRGNGRTKIVQLNKDGSISKVTDYIKAPFHLKLKDEMKK